jgi:hypothetical protein
MRVNGEGTGTLKIKFLRWAERTRVRMSQEIEGFGIFKEGRSGGKMAVLGDLPEIRRDPLETLILVLMEL